VQRPGIGALLMCDLALMRRAATIVDRTRLLGATGTRDIVDELARWTREELDYTVEAANAIAIRENIRDETTEYVPEIHLDLSTLRVLTAERVDGTPLVDIIRELRADRDATTRRLRAAGHDLDQAAANVVWNFLGQVYATGVFHGDLHPANVLLLDGNRIGYVDFGIVGRIPQEVQQSLADYARSLFGGDGEDAVDHLLRWLRPSARTDLAAARAEMLRLTEQFLVDLEHPDAERREILARFQVDLLSTARRHRLSADPLIVLYMKVVLAMDAVTSELAPTLDLQKVHERFFSELIIEGLQSTS
jgi:ubiquinone biosynthesis protein